MATEDGGPDVTLEYGGAFRWRTESWSEFLFGNDGSAKSHDGYTLTRLLLHASLSVGPDIRFFIEGKSAQSTDRDLPGGRRPIDLDTIALHQGYGEVRIPVDGLGGSGADPGLRLRVGRQELRFGAQRLVSPLPWGNTLRTWDGVRADLGVEAWTLTAFATRFVPVDPTEANTPDADRPFHGLYATRKDAVDDGSGTLELYYLYAGMDPVSRNGTTGDEDRHTVGARHQRPLGGAWSIEGEGAWQFGEVGSEDLSAAMLSIEGTRSFAGGDAWTEKVTIGADLATGDHRSGGSVQTFDPLFPLGHAYFGSIDAIGRQNLLGVHAGWVSRAVMKCRFVVSAHSFWRMETADAVYNAGGGVLRAPSGSDEREVGQEIDVELRCTFDEHWSGAVGYGHFFPGRFIRDTGPSDATDFFFVTASLRF